MNKIFLTLLLVFCFYLTGCSNLRQAVGSEKIKFDEFSVVEKDKLVMPPKFDLTAETKSLENKESNAKYEISTLFDVERRIEMDNLDQQFSKLFPLELISENRRILINEETYDIQMQSRSGIDMFFGDNDPPLIGPVLDAKKEQDRLNQLLNK